MNVSNPDRSKNEGSSLVLAILIGVAAVVIISLMMQTSNITKKESKKGEQEDAIAETLNVFNKFDSVMDKTSEDEKKREEARQQEEAAKQEEAARKKKDEGKSPSIGGGGNRPQASAGSLGSGAEPVRIEAGSEKQFFDVVTGADLVRAFSSGSGEEAKPLLSIENPAAAALAEGLIPESGVLENFEEPVTQRSDPKKIRLADLEARAELDVALREAAAVQEGFSATQQPAPVNRLSAPLFSHAAGTFPASRFDLKLKLANPNPKRVSQILYSMNGGAWLPYEGEPIIVPPGAEVRAFCDSSDRDWGDSPTEVRDFFVQTVALSPPRIHTSAKEFDRGANRRIDIAIANPNRNAVSRVEYRLGGSPWQIYREPMMIDGSDYGDAGVKIEARVVGVLGVTGRQASDAVTIDLLPSESATGIANSIAEAGEADSNLRLGNVNLGVPDQPHGYKVRGLNSIGAVTADGANASERFLLETFEAYRRYRDHLESGLKGPLNGGQWGALGMTVPGVGPGASGALLAGRGEDEGVLGESAIDLFDSPAVAAGTFQ